MGRTRISPARHICHADFRHEDLLAFGLPDRDVGRNCADYGDAYRLSRPRLPAGRHRSGNRSASALGWKFAKDRNKKLQIAFAWPWLGLDGNFT
jgi:hypothetical protein